MNLREIPVSKPGFASFAAPVGITALVTPPVPLDHSENPPIQAKKPCSTVHCSSTSGNFVVAHDELCVSAEISFPPPSTTRLFLSFARARAPMNSVIATDRTYSGTIAAVMAQPSFRKKICHELREGQELSGGLPSRCMARE